MIDYQSTYDYRYVHKQSKITKNHIELNYMTAAVEGKLAAKDGWSKFSIEFVEGKLAA